MEQIVYSKLNKFSPFRLNLPLGFILQKGGGAIIIEVVLLHQREVSRYIVVLSEDEWAEI